MNTSVPSFAGRVVNWRMDTLVLATLVAAAWIATHRYQGIWHDGVLYAGQAVFRLDPLPFAKDLFFAYGSQDQFTVFTGIYSQVVQRLGLPEASALLLGVAHVAWLASVAWLLRGLLGGPAFWSALILIVVLPAGYGSSGVFSYGEAFLTARIWAEPPALLAVACIIRGHRIAALACLAFAAAMHPVIAFPAALFVFFFGFRGRQQVALILAGFAGLAILRAVGIPPFADLTQVMDPLWLDLAKERSPWVCLDCWQAGEFQGPFFLALLLAVAAQGCTPQSRRVYGCGLGVFIVGMGLAALAIYWPGIVLIQMQAWRALWLVKILAIAAAVAWVQDTWRISPFSRLLVGGLVAGALTLDGTGLACAAAFSALAIARHRFALEPRLPIWLFRLAWGVIVLVIGETLFWELRLALPLFDFNDAQLSRLSFADRFLIIGKQFGWLIFPPLLLGIRWLLQHRPQSRRWFLGFSGALLVFFGGHWASGRSHLAEEEGLLQVGENAELTGIIGRVHLTHWSGGAPTLWLILQRGSYASIMQTAGIIFSRQTAIEAERRLAKLKSAGLPESSLDWRRRTGALPTNSTTRSGLIHLCHDPILDFVVLPQPAAGTTPMATVRHSVSGARHHLYACASLRAFPDTLSAVP
ncbi:MAG: hypothetical protein V5B38_08865 [Candidatus Accumulibacter propinquus]|jgi:hypothetical protein